MTRLFRRLVLDMGDAPDVATLRALAGLAAALGVDLHGVFIEDEAVLALAQLPFARQYRLPTGEWRPMDAASVAAELRDAAAHTQRWMTQALADVGIGQGFECLRGDPVTCMAGICHTDSIVVLPPPQAVAGQARQRWQPALEITPASVLLLPPRFKPRDGVVAAVLDGLDDPGLALACRVAAALGADMVLFLTEPASAVHAEQVARTAGVARLVTRPLAGVTPAALLAALAGVRERLLILARDRFSGDLAQAGALAETLGAPVLVLASLTAAPIA